MERSVWIGFDPSEADGYAVTRTSLERHANTPVPVRGIVLDDLRDAGLYTRKTELRDGRLFDVVSNHPMATEFAISRFFVPLLVRRNNANNIHQQEAWALFMDSDMLVLEDINRLFEQVDDRYAVMVVKHKHNVAVGEKMGGQLQAPYFRKNWSSIMLFNVYHPANDALDLHLLNNTRGISLHQLCWLQDHQIGELSPRWNWLIGHNKPSDLTPFGDDGVSIAHFTEGLPSMGDQYDEGPYARMWWEELSTWAR